MPLHLNPSQTTACVSFLNGRCPLSASECPNSHIYPGPRHEHPCHDFLRGQRPYDTRVHTVESSQTFARSGRDKHAHPRPESEYYTPASPSECAAHVPVFGALYHPPQRPWYTLASTPQAITPHSEFSSLELPISLSTSPAASDAPSLSNASSDTESAFGSDPSHDTYEPASASVLKLSMPQAMPPHAHSYAPPGFSPNAAHPCMFSPNVGYFPQLPPPPTPIKLDRPPLPRRTTHRKAIAYRSKPCRHWVANETCPKGDLCSFRHDDEDADLRVRYPHQFALLASTASTASTTLPPPPTSTSPVRPSLPLRPKSEIEELRARGIYPITWRVIGGGVKMGGQRQACQTFADGSCAMGEGCPYVHNEKDVLPPGELSEISSTAVSSTTEALVLRPRPAVVILRPAPAPRVTVVEDKAPTTPIAEALSPVSPLDLRSSFVLPADALRRARSTPPELTRRDTMSERQKTFLAESPAF